MNQRNEPREAVETRKILILKPDFNEIGGRYPRGDP